MPVAEIAPDLFRISTYVPQINMQFCQFLVRDDEPLLFHSGLKSMFPLVREAVASLIDPAKLRWVAFSHFESDECGSLNEWLQVAPKAEPLCSMVGALVSVNDFALRPARGLNDGEVVSTGKYRFRFISTPHLPHGWDAGLLFEETAATLLSSDLLHHNGECEPLTEADVLDRVRRTLAEFQASPFANYMPYSQQTHALMQRLAELRPRTIATMHGSAFRGDGEKVLRELELLLREVFGKPSLVPSTR